RHYPAAEHPLAAAAAPRRAGGDPPRGDRAGRALPALPLRRVLPCLPGPRPPLGLGAHRCGRGGQSVRGHKRDEGGRRTMTSAPMRVGMIGLGAIGQGVLTQLAAMPDAAVDIVGVLVRDPSRPRPAGTPPVVGTVEALLALEPEVVVEVAGHEALAQHGPAVLRSGRDLIAVSVGALARPEVYDSLVAAACEGGAQITVASGAIGGLDAISAAAVGGITRVTHTTRKPATTLLGAEGAALTEPRELFRGTAREGV